MKVTVEQCEDYFKAIANAPDVDKIIDIRTDFMVKYMVPELNEDADKNQMVLQDIDMQQREEAVQRMMTLGYGIASVLQADHMLKMAVEKEKKKRGL